MPGDFQIVVRSELFAVLVVAVHCYGSIVSATDNDTVNTGICVQRAGGVSSDLWGMLWDDVARVGCFPYCSVG